MSEIGWVLGTLEGVFRIERTGCRSVEVDGDNVGEAKAGLLSLKIFA